MAPRFVAVCRRVDFADDRDVPFQTRSDRFPEAGSRAPCWRRSSARSVPIAAPVAGVQPIARRRFYRETGPVKRTRVNHMIRLSPIRLIGPENEQIGVVETHDAIRRAEEAGLDLVEVVPDSRPPVCKIMDYGKYKYELSKKEQKNRAAAKQNELKEIRLGRSVKIDKHDVQIRVDQARKFLLAGHKVQFTQRFRGREMQHKELGIERLAEIVESLSDIAKVDTPPRWMGRQASLILSPDKNKVIAYKKALEAKGEAPVDFEAEAAKIEADLGPDDEPDHDHEDARDDEVNAESRG